MSDQTRSGASLLFLSCLLYTSVERNGIGTPATRAAIIEKLVQKGFIERRGDKKTKYLFSTDNGNTLVTVVPEQIQSPSMTADWEEKLLISSMSK